MPAVLWGAVLYFPFLIKRQLFVTPPLAWSLVQHQKLSHVGVWEQTCAHSLVLFTKVVWTLSPWISIPSLRTHPWTDTGKGQRFNCLLSQAKDGELTSKSFLGLKRNKNQDRWNHHFQRLMTNTHGTRTCIKRKKITYGKFFDFCAEKCVYN